MKDLQPPRVPRIPPPPDPFRRCPGGSAFTEIGMVLLVSLYLRGRRLGRMAGAALVLISVNGCCWMQRSRPTVPRPSRKH